MHMKYLQPLADILDHYETILRSMDEQHNKHVFRSVNQQLLHLSLT